MIVGLSLQAVFPLIVLAALFLLPALAVFGAIFTTRPGKSLAIASAFESLIRSASALLFLGIVYFAAPAIGQTVVEFGIKMPKLTTLTLRLAQTIRQLTVTPWQIGRLLFFLVSAVAANGSMFYRLGRDDVADSRKFSLIVSAITFSILGLMAISLLLPCVKLLNDLS